jgi:undecaprenyl-diphosphatase
LLALAAGASTLCAGHARAGGPFGIDHEVALDERGIWGRQYQTALENGVIVFELASALWEGSDSKLGKTSWEAVDSSAISAVAAVALKRALGRARPAQENDPNAWFKGSCCESFPSGEVTLQASFVTPFIANYARDNAWIWALELLPAYDAMARVKSRAHWQSDVLAGWALGSGIGYWSATRSVPISVEILPRAVTVGISKRF